MYGRGFITFLLCTMCVACGGGAKGSARAARTTGIDNGAAWQSPETEDFVEELPLPQLPDSLREPSARAGFIVEHFWDAMNFCDTLRSHSVDFLEQNFANFISVFPYAELSARERAVGTLLASAEADKEAYVLLSEVAEKYLYDPNSPMLNEDFYAIFVDRFLQTPVLDQYEKIRFGYQRDALRKNRAGTKAANFAYIDRNGARSTLHSTPSGELLLVIFYDPDCGHCKEIMETLMQSARMSQMVAAGELSVLAIYSGEMRELWEETNGQLPSEWMVGYDTTDIEEKGLYIFRAMPTLYLLDRNKEVVAKDIPSFQLLEYFEGI